ncbi:hypothetical protein B0H10DRAFT_2428145 [Mycena sp. CBHHK59/15]|nr:hypothetical protein B0H10DRAFT_2428145 [Mycena sp. CBHHK59/15]
MVSKLTPDDQKLIDSLPMGVVTAFRSSIYQSGFVAANPQLFISSDWIDAVQLRAFLQRAVNPGPQLSPPPPESLPTRVKLEYDAFGTREVFEILSDSDVGSDSEDSPIRGENLAPQMAHPRQFSPLPPSDIPSDTSYTATEVTVQRVEYLTEFASLYPIPETPTAFVVNAQHPKFDIRDKHGNLYTVDALIKNKDNDSWRGNTGTCDSKVLVSFEPGEAPILCRRSRLACKGAYVCEPVDPRLLEVIRRDLDPASRDAVFAAQRQTRREEGTTPERKVTQFIQLIRTQKCNATDKDGVKCKGVPILRSKKEISRGHKFWAGCSGYSSESTGRHRRWSIPDDVDEPMFVRAQSGEPLVDDDSKDTPPCSAIVHPTTGLKQRHCPHSHIFNGQVLTSSIVNRPCDAARTIYVPVNPSIRKALIIHSHNVAHNHPMPALKKASFELKESYRQCIKAAGCVGVTVAKVDNAPSTQVLLGGKTPAEFAPPLQSKCLIPLALPLQPPDSVPGVREVFLKTVSASLCQHLVYMEFTATVSDGTRWLGLTPALEHIKHSHGPGKEVSKVGSAAAGGGGGVGGWRAVTGHKNRRRKVPASAWAE